MPNKSFNITFNGTHRLLVLMVTLLFFGCSKSSDQRAFEDRAFSAPENITEMSEHGETVENRTDPDDWRIGPMFQGLIEIDTPAYPNPVNLNQPVAIDIDVRVPDAANGLEVYVFQDPNNPDEIRREPIFQRSESPLQTGILTVDLDPGDFSRFGTGDQATGLYRILIYDGQQNLISYGDIEVI